MLVSDNWHCVLSDFGLSVRKSRVMKTAAAEKAMHFKAIRASDKYGTIPTFLPGIPHPIGTPLHVAPEISRKLPFNEKADIYSFGIFFWEVITRESISKLQKERDMHTILTPVIPDYVPDIIQKFLTQCLDDDPLMRPSIDEIAVSMEVFKDITFVKKI